MNGDEPRCELCHLPTAQCPHGARTQPKRRRRRPGYGAIGEKAAKSSGSQRDRCGRCKHPKEDHANLGGCLVCFRCASFVVPTQRKRERQPKCLCAHYTSKHNESTYGCAVYGCGCTKYRPLSPKKDRESSSVFTFLGGLLSRTVVGTSGGSSTTRRPRDLRSFRRTS